MARPVVKFGKFKWDPGGYRAVKNDPAVQAVLRSKAKAVKRAACAAAGRGEVILDEDGSGEPIRVRGSAYDEEPFATAEAVLPKVKDMGYVVYTRTRHGKYEQAKRKTLTKALGAAKGG